MGTTPIGYGRLGLAAAVGTVLLLALPIVVRQQQAAHAEQIRTRCVRELAAKDAWRAEFTETESGPDGTRQVTQQELLVRRPDEYRLTLRERDAKGDEVVSTTIRTADALFTHRTKADGSTEMHVVRGAHPSLGIELDNLLGQTVQAVADAEPLKIVGTGSRNGRTAEKLELGPGRFVWVDRETGLPVEEQVVADGKVTHSVRVNLFDGQPLVSDTEFDPSSLGSADATTVEDLGFRPVSVAASAAAAIGFEPLAVPAPAGFSEDVQGYVDPSVPQGDALAEGSFVNAFSQGPDGVIVTQVSRPGIGDSFVPAESDAGSFERLVVSGRPAALFRDATRLRLVFARRDVLVTIEGDLPESAMTELAERVRP